MTRRVLIVKHNNFCVGVLIIRIYDETLQETSTAIIYNYTDKRTLNIFCQFSKLKFIMGVLLYLSTRNLY